MAARDFFKHNFNSSACLKLCISALSDDSRISRIRHFVRMNERQNGLWSCLPDSGVATRRFFPGATSSHVSVVINITLHKIYSLKNIPLQYYAKNHFLDHQTMISRLLLLSMTTASSSFQHFLIISRNSFIDTPAHEIKDYSSTKIFFHCRYLYSTVGICLLACSYKQVNFKTGGLRRCWEGTEHWPYSSGHFPSSIC